MRFRDRLARFFYGRYGIDGLYYALLVTYFILCAAGLFVRNLYASLFLSGLELFVIVWMFYRMLSRNHAPRRRENEAFMKILRSVKDFFIITKNRIRDIKSYRYRKCPHCKATLRLPKRKGEHSVVCPRCKERFSVKVRF